MMEKRKIKKFLSSEKFKFGDFLLFQEYKYKFGCRTDYQYKVSRPILAIYLGHFVADQTAGFNYVKWVNENHGVKITNEHVADYIVREEVDGIHQHIEWDDYIDILGRWEYRPSWKEILTAYRKKNTKEEMSSDEIDWKE